VTFHIKCLSLKGIPGNYCSGYVACIVFLLLWDASSCYEVESVTVSLGYTIFTVFDLSL
jgi:hypothetical protein